MDDRDQLTTADLASRAGDEVEQDEDLDIRAGREAESEDATEREADLGQPLLEDEDSRRFRDRWQEIQTGFVDRPRESVEEADRLVADLMQRLAGQFAQNRSNLERQWDGDEDVSTEDLRVALTQYRSFFERLLSA
jgi:hypothetical protein